MVKKLALILLVAEAVNIGAYVMQGRLSDRPFMEVDSERYLSLADGMARHGRFVHASGDAAFGVWHTPGYPLYLLGLRLVGVRAPAAIALTHHLWLLLAVVLACLLGRALLGTGAGLAAAFIQAVHLASAAYGNEVLTEALFVPLVTAGVLCVFQYKRTSRWAYLLGAAAGLAASMFVRPVSLYAVGPAALVLLTPRPGMQALRRRVASAALLLAGVAAPAAAWAWHNYSVSGIFNFCATGSQSVAFWSAGGALARAEGISLKQAQARIEQGLTAKELGARRYRQMNRLSRRILAEHPRQAAEAHLFGMLRMAVGASTWCDLLGGRRPFASIAGDPLGTLADWRYSIPLAVEMSLVAASWLLAFAGGVIAWRRGYRWEVLTVALLVSYFLVVAGGPAAGSRYRAAFWPIVSVLAGVSLAARSVARRPVPAAPRCAADTAERSESGLPHVEPTA